MLADVMQLLGFKLIRILSSAQALSLHHSNFVVGCVQVIHQARQSFIDPQCLSDKRNHKVKDAHVKFEQVIAKSDFIPKDLSFELQESFCWFQPPRIWTRSSWFAQSVSECC